MAAGKKKTKVAGKKASAKKAPAKKSPLKKVKAVIKAAVKPKAQSSPAKRTAPAKRISLEGLITPLDDRIIVRADAPSEKTAGGIIIPGTVSERPTRGEVLAKGRGRRNKKGIVRPLDVGVGDYVLFPQHAGTKLTLDGEDVLILREEDLLGIVT